MIPIGAIIGAIASSQRRGAQRTDPRFVLVVLLRFLVAPVLISMVGGIVGGPVFASFLLLSYALTWFPLLILKLVLVPLRLSRAAYFFSFVITPIVFVRSPRATGALFGMLAVLRSREIDLHRVDWLESKMLLEPVRGESLLARALIAAARKDHERARELLFALAPARGTPWLVRRTAHEWLIADAASRGEWSRAAQIGTRTTFRWVLALRWMARRIAQEANAPSDFALWFAWLWAPRRVATFTLLRRALSIPRRPIAAEAASYETATETATATDASPLHAALSAHAECLQSGGASLDKASVAWDAARHDPAISALFARRALALSATVPPDSALLRVLAAAEEDLTSCIVNGAPLRAVPSLTYFTVTARLRAEQLREVEHLAAAMRRRTIDQQDLAPIDEWLEWSRLRAAAERVLAGADDSTRRSVFETVYLPVCNHGVRLFNLRKQGILGNAMFRWLLPLTKKDEQPAAHKLITKNCRAPFV